ncbi:uncharacterized protein PV06_00522 [Exophiala oligosperma]|uniref:Uncharacterized protein n=2 Tax=Chaetothyriales TaxID=34395 RepID=A0A0D2B6I6_9EURO|nr:uncharacterized protein PV06_00522 [Exophiala oligosperma]KAJ9626826.1 hypothetical protein H2204_009842 [Knufia peltigerae]KIW47866.1 hypothetical protein PV06_00522 [Exophiala oligosperma]
MCNRCITADRDCLYKSPRPWIFEGSVSKVVAVAIDRAGGSLLAPKTIPLQEQHGFRPNQYNPRILARPQIARQIIHALGDTPEERRSIRFWLSETAPNLTKSWLNHEVWAVVVPLWATVCPACRHLLVAAALADEQLRINKGAGAGVGSPSTNLTRSTFCHYQWALRRISSIEIPDPLQIVGFIVASLISWVFEAAQGNALAANVHIKAASRILRELEVSTTLSSLELDQLAELKPVVYLLQTNILGLVG